MVATMAVAACSSGSTGEPSASSGFALRVGANGLTMDVGDSLQIQTTVSTNDARVYTLAYKSSNDAIASVSATGVVKALAAGSATVTAVATLLDTGGVASATVQATVGEGGSAGSVQTTFAADPSVELQNPERGYYFRVGPNEACSSILVAVRYGADYRQKVTLAYYEVDPATFSAASFNADMDCVRAAGMKIILGEVYCSTFGCDEGVTAAQAETQLAAMGPAVKANKDVISVVRVGAIGGWGEGATWNGADVSDSVRTRIRDAIVEMAPPELPLVHRNPMYVFQWYPVTTASTAFSGTVGSRMGIVNDCFLSAPDDHYTYPDGSLRAKTAAQTEFAPFGAETCDGGDTRLSCKGGTTNDGSPGGIMNEGPRYHLTYLHRGYYDGFMTEWGGLDDQGNRGPGDCYDTVTNYMGYRFQLDGLSHVRTIGRGQTAAFDVDARDVGWARIFSARKLVVTLRHKTNSAARPIVGSGGDARLLPSQATSSTRIAVNVTVPSDATPGDYDVFLSMPDIWPATKDDARQAVRFANADGQGQSWDGANARFKSGTTLTVN